MSLDTGAICELEDVKDFLNLQSVDHDDLLMQLINRVTVTFQSYCDRIFLSATHTEHLDGDGSKLLFPLQWPITSVTTIHDDSDWTWGSDTLVDSGEYAIEDEVMIRMKSSSFSAGARNVKIVYVGGYTAAVMPKDLVQACVEQVAWSWKESGAGSGLLNVESKSSPDGQQVAFRTYLSEKGLLDSVVSVLDKYRRVKI